MGGGIASSSAFIAAETGSWPTAAPSDDLVRCPACGIANPVTRTFCQSCGTTLAAAARVAEPPPDVVAAAVSAVPTAPPAAGTASGAARPRLKDSPGRRGIPGWVLAVGALGLIVGVGIVGASVLFRGSGPDSGASTGPGAPSGAVASGGAAGPSGAPASGVTGGTPVELALTGATASSVVGNRAKFQPAKAIDGNPATSWQEGSAREKDEWIEVTFDAARADSLVIRNGYQASDALFKGNRRLKDVLVSVDGGSPIAVRLKDSQKPQTVDLGGVSGATSVRVTIVTTYAGQATSVSGTPFDDAAVSELSVMGVPGG